jgi:hypothetical protein
MFRPVRAILRLGIQLYVSKDYSYYNGSAVRTQLDVCLYRYFDPWSPIHVIKLSTNIKLYNQYNSLWTLVLHIKCKNVKISKWVGICVSLWWSGWSSKFCGLPVYQRRVDRAVGSGGFLSYACYCFVSSSWLVLSVLEMQVFLAVWQF